MAESVFVENEVGCVCGSKTRESSVEVTWSEGFSGGLVVESGEELVSETGSDLVWHVGSVGGIFSWVLSGSIRCVIPDFREVVKGSSRADSI